MTETDENSAIERLMDEHDLSREAAKGALEAAQTDADVALACVECGVAERESRIVSGFVDPRDGAERALCDSCFTRAVRAGTLLSSQQAEILPLLLDGWTTTEIAEVVGTTTSNVTAQKSKIKRKHGEAMEQRERAERTIAVLENLQ